MFVNNNKCPQPIDYDRDINMVITYTSSYEVKALYTQTFINKKNTIKLHVCKQKQTASDYASIET